jgi:hypothetical protein
LGQFQEILEETLQDLTIQVQILCWPNVLSVVVEVPKAMLGTASTLNVWSETKKTIINFILKLKIMKTNKFKIITFALSVQ